ncbi:homeobox protein 4-like isoform X1 [Linepithema humile]|uniref:homeobox protein 4-like isoform X1 n=1 Tax=Linepithema humile TaxID=83485 RepID=UPI00351EF989
MFYDVTSTNFDHCVKKLNFSDYAADVCIPTIIQNTTTCNKENTSITCNKENTSITCNEENTSITCNKENTSITCNKENTSTTCNKENINPVPLSVLSPISSPVPALHEKIHREHYRQPLASRDILKISQYLEAVQGNAQDLNESSSDSEHEEDEENEKVEDDNNNNNDNNNTSTMYMDKENLSLNVPSHNTSIDGIIIENEIQKNNKRKRSTSPYGKTKRTRWTEKEKETVLQAFAIHMGNLTLPSLQEIQEIKKKYKCLSHRTSPQIKTWIHNKQKTLRQSTYE